MEKTIDGFACRKVSRKWSNIQYRWSIENWYLNFYKIWQQTVWDAIKYYIEEPTAIEDIKAYFLKNRI